MFLPGLLLLDRKQLQHRFLIELLLLPIDAASVVRLLFRRHELRVAANSLLAVESFCVVLLPMSVVRQSLGRGVGWSW